MALDIVFISYHEPNAEQNWKELQKRFPYALRVDKVDGIPEAFIEAARISKTSHIYTVDGDNKILPAFEFDFVPDYWEEDFVHLWYAKNPVNDLCYGYGGLKLWPRRFLKQAQVNKHSVDFTLPASHAGRSGLKIHKEAVSITCFNTSPFDSYRAGFREGAKLIAEILSNGKSWYREEAENRLEVWITRGERRPFGEECIRGAKDGVYFGSSAHHDLEELSKINSFDFLRGRFERYGNG